MHSIIKHRVWRVCVALHVFTITHITVRAVHQVHKTGVWCADTHFENTPPQLFHARTASFHHTQHQHHHVAVPCSFEWRHCSTTPRHTLCSSCCSCVFNAAPHQHSGGNTTFHHISNALPSSVSLHTTFSIMPCVLSSASHCVAPTPLQQCAAKSFLKVLDGGS